MQEAKTYSTQTKRADTADFMNDAVKRFLTTRIEERGTNLATVSKQLGKNHAYLQQFVNRGIPRTLPEEVRRRLSDILDVDDALLGGPRKSFAGNRLDPAEEVGDVVMVKEVDALVSAGAGVINGEHDGVKKVWPFNGRFIRDELGLGGSELTIVEIRGDSMSPTLSSGDRVMVNHDDKQVSQGGIFAVWMGDGTVVKRIEQVPASNPPVVKLISDNPLHSNYEVPAVDVSIIGRVIWRSSRI